jgi:DNA polymerase III epsilon subunit-like protein
MNLSQDVDKYTLPEIYEDKIQSKDIFYKLVLPDKRMNPQASKVNGIKKMGKYNLSVRGVLHRNVKIPRFALGDFVTWLESFKNVKLVLVAHNGNKFDIPVLTNQEKFL